MEYTKEKYWRVKNLHNRETPYRIYTVVHGLEYDIADVIISIGGDTEKIANLIAAAPQLYETLRDLHDKLEPYAGDFDKDTLALLTVAEMAINLAEGK